MNFKKTWNRSEGFTLVELIVVIAILAILAGVAVPAYSGYIKKAEKAADLQLLGAVNTAFAAACLENGEDVTDVRLASITLRGNVGEKVVNAVSPYNDSFFKYFEGNRNSMFKVITNLQFVNGVFVDPANATGVVSADYGNGGKLYMTQNQIDAINNSPMVDSLGVDNLLGMVDSVAALGGNSDMLTGILATPDLMADMVVALGGTLPANATPEQIRSAYMAAGDASIRQAMASKLNIPVSSLPEDIEGSEYEDLYYELNDTMTNNLSVLVAAQNASKQSAESVMNIINSSNPKSEITGTLSTNPGATLGNAALVYAAMTAYAEASNDTTMKNQLQSDDLTAAFDLLKDDPTTLKNFQAYMNSDDGQADLNASLAALAVVSGSANDQAALNEVLVSGFNNTNLIGSINGMLGKNS